MGASDLQDVTHSLDTAPTTGAPPPQGSTSDTQTHMAIPTVEDSKINALETIVKPDDPFSEIGGIVSNEIEPSTSASDTNLRQLLQPTTIFSVWNKIFESLSRPPEESDDPGFLSLNRLSILLTESDARNIVRYLVDLGNHRGLDELSDMHLRPYLYDISNSTIDRVDETLLIVQNLPFIASACPLTLGSTMHVPFLVQST